MVRADGIASMIDLFLPSSNTTVIYGADANDQAGIEFSSGDINGDRYADIIIGAFYANGPGNGRLTSGEVWIIYGIAAGLGSSIDLASPPGNTFSHIWRGCR